tara:strand:- start:790 stop:1200 length:411 start_codon:yes stop_codon:yes gene_type:complete
MESLCASTLVVDVENISVNQGHIYMAVYKLASESTWDDPPVRTLKQPVEARQQRFTIDDLSRGRYAIRLYHDVNINQQLDTSKRGLPREPVGFSNNIRLKKGAPAISDCSFSIDDEAVALSIQLRGKIKVDTQKTP